MQSWRGLATKLRSWFVADSTDPDLLSDKLFRKPVPPHAIPKASLDPFDKVDELSGNFHYFNRDNYVPSQKMEISLEELGKKACKIINNSIFEFLFDPLS
jgi:hypothetical protein